MIKKAHFGLSYEVQAKSRINNLLVTWMKEKKFHLKYKQL